MMVLLDLGVPISFAKKKQKIEIHHRLRVVKFQSSVQISCPTKFDESPRFKVWRVMAKKLLKSPGNSAESLLSLLFSKLTNKDCFIHRAVLFSVLLHHHPDMHHQPNTHRVGICVMYLHPRADIGLFDLRKTNTAFFRCSKPSLEGWNNPNLKHPFPPESWVSGNFWIFPLNCKETTNIGDSFHFPQRKPDYG